VTGVQTVAEQTQQHNPMRKLSAEQRISDLVKTVRGLEAKLEVALRENEQLKAAETEQRTLVNHFMAECEAICKAQPEFDQCLRRISDVPETWLHEILRMPNPTGFIVFLAGANEFLEYLRELQPAAAVRRIRRAGYDVYNKLPKFQGGK